MLTRKRVSLFLAMSCCVVAGVNDAHAQSSKDDIDSAVARCIAAAKAVVAAEYLNCEENLLIIPGFNYLECMRRAGSHYDDMYNICKTRPLSSRNSSGQ